MDTIHLKESSVCFHIYSFSLVNVFSLAFKVALGFADATIECKINRLSCCWSGQCILKFKKYLLTVTLDSICMV